MVELITGAARVEAQKLLLDSPRQRELVGTVAMGIEVARQIDEHVAEFLHLDKSDQGTVH
jgi:hypothetical protein